MVEQSVIVWDLETVPDLAAAARMLDMVEEPEADVRCALGSGFPKHPLHKIVCIGGLIASRQTEGWRIDALGAPHIGERTEGELISAFVEKWGNCVRNSSHSTATALTYLVAVRIKIPRRQAPSLTDDRPCNISAVGSLNSANVIEFCCDARAEFRCHARSDM